MIEPRCCLALRGGVVPVEPVAVVFGLEAAGFMVTNERDDVITIRPGSSLSSSQLAQVTKWRAEILAVVRSLQVIQ